MNEKDSKLCQFTGRKKGQVMEISICGRNRLTAATPDN